MTITSSTQIDTIIFDLGAVLIDWNPEYLYRKIFDEEDQMRYFLKNICTSAWNAEQDAGRSWAEAVALLIEQHPQHKAEIKAYWKRWPEMLNGPIQGSVNILKQLQQKKSHRLLALTNWSAETWHHAWDQYDFLRIFEGILVSGKEQIKKPDPRIYQLLVDRYKLVPEKALFIDDSPANVKSAREFGLHAIHFTAPEKLKQELQKAEII